MKTEPSAAGAGPCANTNKETGVTPNEASLSVTTTTLYIDQLLFQVLNRKIGSLAPGDYPYVGDLVVLGPEVTYDRGDAERVKKECPHTFPDEKPFKPFSITEIFCVRTTDSGISAMKRYLVSARDFITSSIVGRERSRIGSSHRTPSLPEGHMSGHPPDPHGPGLSGVLSEGSQHRSL